MYAAAVIRGGAAREAASARVVAMAVAAEAVTAAPRVAAGLRLAARVIALASLMVKLALEPQRGAREVDWQRIQPAAAAKIARLSARYTAACVWLAAALGTMGLLPQNPYLARTKRVLGVFFMWAAQQQYAFARADAAVAAEFKLLLLLPPPSPPPPVAATASGLAALLAAERAAAARLDSGCSNAELAAARARMQAQRELMW